MQELEISKERFQALEKKYTEKLQREIYQKIYWEILGKRLKNMSIRYLKLKID